MPDIRSSRARMITVIITAGLATAISIPVNAADCETLEARIAALGRAASVHPEYAKWNAAAKRQAMALRAAERDARRHGCLQGDPGSTCGPMMAKIERMRANLAGIEERRDRYGDLSGENDAARAALERQYRRQDCDAELASPQFIEDEEPADGGFTPRREPAPSLSVSSRHGNELNRSRTSYVPDGRPLEGEQGLVSARFGSGYYRTLCVRTCDGYYFPVSFKTQKYGFGRDEVICRSMCPAADTALYVHLNPGESAEDMISLEGIPYRKQENAFIFRKRFVEGCSCQGDAGNEDAIESLIRSGDRQARSYTHSNSLDPDVLDSGVANLVPAPAIPEGADPDTAMNIRLGFAPQASSPSISKLGEPSRAQPESLAAKPADPGKRKVRIVGPRYFVAQ